MEQALYAASSGTGTGALAWELPASCVPEGGLNSLSVDRSSGLIALGENSVSLTLREFFCLEHLMRHAGSIRTTEMLYDWNYGSKESSRDPKIIDVFICKLRQKLLKLVAQRFIATVDGRGYIVGKPERQERGPEPIRYGPEPSIIRKGTLSAVDTPLGPISGADLPAADTVRWTCLRKAAVGYLVNGGLLSEQAALARYPGTTPAELRTWCVRASLYGADGLRSTRFLEYRNMPEAREHV